jgi:hypothetical protein
MGLAWFRKPTVSVEVLGAEIIVRMPGTRFSVVFEKTDDNQLIASSFSAVCACSLVDALRRAAWVRSLINTQAAR